MSNRYIYDQAFQDMTARVSAYAARRVISIVRTVVPVRSVIDIGCSRGTWLREWHEQAVHDVVGVDGPDVDRGRFEIDPRYFVVRDLSVPFNLGRRFDLAQSLEVAEHLPPDRAATFVADIVAHAPVVPFSAATPGQGGEYHLNERTAQYWRDCFRVHDYVAIDCLRPLLRREQDIPTWYRYNLILYAERREVDRICPFARQFQVPEDEPISDSSPLLYRARKCIVRLLPRSLSSQLARLHARHVATKRSIRI